MFEDDHQNEMERLRVRKKRFMRKAIGMVLVVALLTPIFMFSSGKFVGLMDVLSLGGSSKPESSIQFLTPPTD